MAREPPGKQFREGMSLIEVFKTFPADAAAAAWFVRRRWPTGTCCPYCGSLRVLTGAKRKTMTYQCRERGCRGRFSVRFEKVRQGSTLGYQAWALAISLMTTNLKSVSSMKLHRDLDVMQMSAWHLGHRLRDVFEGGGEFSADGPVEAGETYMGGAAATC